VLSASPTVVMEEVVVDLPGARDQLTTRSEPRFAELRSHIYTLIQHAKEGRRPDATA
jgi:NitT/TauT family transport system ATP-binding protein